MSKLSLVLGDQTFPHPLILHVPYNLITFNCLGIYLIFSCHQENRFIYYQYHQEDPTILHVAHTNSD